MKLSLLFLTAALAFAHDFRAADWGMTKDQVVASEKSAPLGHETSGEQLLLRYVSPEGAMLHGRLTYIFVGGKLVRAKYISDARHEDVNEFINDFMAAERVISAEFGKPATDRTVWESDASQLERLPYLEQDRAHASDILPSDNAGISVALGHLKMYTERIKAGTRIVHALTGSDSRITHQIEFRSIELEKRENTAARQGEPSR